MQYSELKFNTTSYFPHSHFALKYIISIDSFQSIKYSFLRNSNLEVVNAKGLILKKKVHRLSLSKTHLMECNLPIPFDKKCLFYLFPPSRTNIHRSKLRTVNKFDLQWFVRNTQQSRLHTDWRIVIFQDKPLYQLKMITHKLE